MSPNAQPTRVNRVSATSRTAVYGPVRTVVWEGRSREAPPYPDLWRLADVLSILIVVCYWGGRTLADLPPLPTVNLADLDLDADGRGQPDRRDFTDRSAAR